MRLDGRTYEDAFTVKPDPRTKFKQVQFEQTYAFLKKYSREFSIVDTMLNALDSVKKQLDTAKTNAKTSGNAALQAQITQALTGREQIFSELTANYQNDEDSIQRPGALREDLQSIGFFGQGVITPPVSDYGRRVDAGYRAAVQRYNAYVRTLVPINNALRAAGLKPAVANPVIP
jgi:hypothetical protein